MKEAVIVAATRTAVGRARRRTPVNLRPDEMAATVVGEVLHRADGVEPEMVEDVILGCSFPEAEQGMNVGRIAVLRRFAQLGDGVDDQPLFRIGPAGHHPGR